MSYQSKIEQWEKYSSIRSRPRRIFADEESPGYVFPPARQPILVHPKLASIDETQRRYILVQSLFKYMNDIANIEKDIINSVSLKINKNMYFLKFSPSVQLDALSVIIDESYHAYVALDFMQQVELSLGIPSLPLSNETALSTTIKKIASEIPQEMVDNFKLIAVCIAEHALTNDLIAVAKSKDVCKTFYYVMHDHVLDENRHAKLFEYVLKKFWEVLPENQKKIIGLKLPSLINGYLSPTSQKDFDSSILKSLGFNAEDIKEIVEDTHCGWDPKSINQQNIIAKQMIELLRRTDVLSGEEILHAFSEYGIN
jgi:hypothetical protein